MKSASYTTAIEK